MKMKKQIIDIYTQNFRKFGKEWISLISQKNNFNFGAYKNGALSGVITFMKYQNTPDEEIYEILSLAVLMDEKNRGIGKLLVDKIKRIR